MPSNNDYKILLGFDIGLKRTGVASGHSLSKSARPAGQLMVKNGRFDWLEVDKIIQQWEPSALVIGDPQSDDPALKKVINRFKSHIQQNHKLPIIDIDERLSSVAANAEIAEHGFSTERKTFLRDQVAACLILESYFNSLSWSKTSAVQQCRQYFYHQPLAAKSCINMALICYPSQQ